jgi:hypothetical protein
LQLFSTDFSAEVEFEIICQKSHVELKVEHQLFIVKQANRALQVEARVDWTPTLHSIEASTTVSTPQRDLYILSPGK